MNKKTKMLGIVPYDGMKLLIEQTAVKRTDVDVTVYVGDLKEGAEIASRYSSDDYDVILSRGGTAQMIRETCTLPVIEIPLSLNDILRAVKLAENSKKKYSIVGFPSITKNAKALNDLLLFDFDIYTIHNELDAETILQQLVLNDYDMVLCDMITHSLSQKVGIPAILITSGMESITDALDSAASSDKTYKRIRLQSNFYKALAEGKRNHPLYVFNDRSELIVQSENIGNAPEKIISLMNEQIPMVIENSEKSLYLKEGKSLFHILGRTQYINDELFIVFELSRKVQKVGFQKKSISFIGKEEAYDSFFNSFYGITQSTSILNRDVELCNKNRTPILIIGETGTGKEHMLRLIYAKSSLSSNPLIIVDCIKINEKEWNFLLTNEESPLMDIDNSIYFKKVDGLSEKQFSELIEVINSNSLHQMNKIYFTESININEELSDRGKFLIQHFSCTIIDMPPLREQKENIPNLASLYISTLNMQLVREVIGFTPTALELLEEMDWPYNYDQFKRVLKELVEKTDTLYIQEETVKLSLRKEKYLSPRLSGDLISGIDIDTDRTLEEINLKIIERILVEEGGNQKATASRLGISRTTLWRMLQKNIS